MVVKNYLNEKGIDYEERNIAQAENRNELIKMNIMSIPVIKVDEEVFGFDNFNALRDRLDKGDK